LLNGGTGTSASEDYLHFLGTNKLAFYQANATSTVIATNAVFRDPSAWYHIVLVYDSAQATAANRLFIYVNGVSQSFSSATYPTLNQTTNINASGVLQRISSRTYAADEGFDGYLTEVNFIDGQALTPSSFGAINATTGVWSATKYAGTYGTNGFYLNFSDNSAATATTIGKDFSGNGNNWTPNNISVTAGATYDSMLDAPLGAGGGERGNYCVVNPLDNFYNGGTISNGNLQLVTGSSSNSFVRGTLGVTSGKWYFEATANATSSGNTWYDVGWSGRASPSSSAGLGDGPDEVGYLGQNGAIRRNSAEVSSGTTYTTGDVIGVMIDLDSNLAYFSKNGTLINSGTGYSVPAASATTTGVYCPALGDFDNAGTKTWIANFGQRPFSYTPPTGFKALHTGNLGAPVIALPAQNMAATLYTGNSSTQTISNAVNGVSMQPDWVWIKNRSTVAQHVLTDSVRGIDRQLFSSLTNAEQTSATAITALNSNGFSLGANPSPTGSTNSSPDAFVAWQWKAGGTAVSNTAGSITSSVSANTTAGFSVVTYMGTGVAATIGHGLGVAPSMMITKNRTSGAQDWHCYHASLGNSAVIFLNTTAAQSTGSADWWNNTTPTSSVFSVGTGGATNGNTQAIVAYCFAPVANYSVFGSYTANASTDGPFIYTGFRPRFVLLKNASRAIPWEIFDSSRNTSNIANSYLLPNASNAEASDDIEGLDFLSNGIKIRGVSTSYNNHTSGDTYIYMAFAESPFKNSLAR
jgi:hypothetical protein